MAQTTENIRDLMNMIDELQQQNWELQRQNRELREALEKAQGKYNQLWQHGNLILWNSCIDCKQPKTPSVFLRCEACQKEKNNG